MKYKLLLLILSFSIVIVSCKKDNADKVTADATVVLKQKVLGSWGLTKITVEAFDESGKVVRTEDQTPVGGVQTWEFFDNGTANSNDSRGLRKYTYSITSTNGKNNITLTYNSADTFEVAIENDRMTWVLQGPSNNSAFATAKQTYSLSRK